MTLRLFRIILFISYDSYDSSGNRVSKVEQHQGEEENYTVSYFNSLNQLTYTSTYYETSRTTTDYSYDVYGNLKNDNEYSYTYDEYFNRLISTRNLATNEITTYDYYVDGLRKSKNNTYYIWLDGNMVYEFSGNESSTYTYGHRLIYSDDVKYVLNAHGDVVALLNANGVVTKRYEYDAFGNELGVDNTDTNPFRYCGEYFDTETETIYLMARYYNVSNRRFTTRDSHWNVGNMIYGDIVQDFPNYGAIVKVVIYILY